MTAILPQPWWSRLARAPIAWCLLLSALLHVVVILEIRVLQVVMQRWPTAIPEWVRKSILPTPTVPKPSEVAAKEEAEKERLEDPSLMFVEVDPAAITDEAPK